MTSSLRYRPVMIPAMEFYNEDGHFTKETTAAYKKSLDFSKRSRDIHLSSYINQIHNAAADYQKTLSLKTHYKDFALSKKQIKPALTWKQ